MDLLLLSECYVTRGISFTQKSLNCIIMCYITLHTVFGDLIDLFVCMCVCVHSGKNIT